MIGFVTIQNTVFVCCHSLNVVTGPELRGDMKGRRREGTKGSTETVL